MADGLLSGIALFAMGQFAALVVAFVKMMNELVYIKGQIEHFVRQVDRVDVGLSDVETSLAVIDKAQVKTAADLDHAFDKVRDLEEEIRNNNVQ